MSYKIAVVGHGHYPEGVLSALALLVGTTDGVSAFNLDENTTHTEFKETLNDFLENNEQVIVFADMTGGAPHQITAELLLEKDKPYQYIISSAPMNLILDLYAKALGGLENDDIDNVLAHTLHEAKRLIELMPNRVAESESDTAEVSGTDSDTEEGI